MATTSNRHNIKLTCQTLAVASKEAVTIKSFVELHCMSNGHKNLFLFLFYKEMSKNTFNSRTVSSKFTK